MKKALLPLRFRMLHYMSTVKEASVDDIMRDLKDEYGSERQFNKVDIKDHMLSMKENGILDDTRAELDEQKELRVYYSINEEGRVLLRKYLPKQWRS